MTEQAPPVTFIDDAHAPEVFADSCAGIFFLNGNIRLTFFSSRVDHSTTPGPINNVVVGRLILPLAAAENLRLFLEEYLPKVTAQNAPPQAPAPGGTVH